MPGQMVNVKVARLVMDHPPEATALVAHVDKPVAIMGLPLVFETSMTHEFTMLMLTLTRAVNEKLAPSKLVVYALFISAPRPLPVNG
jgi:hypothetical protein